MASHSRSFYSSWAQGNDDNNAARQPVLNVMPLNSVPFSGPPSSNSRNPFYQMGTNHGAPIRNQPAMVFLPSHSTEEELERVVAATNHGVVVTGSAALGKVGRPIGSIDISESVDTYMFRIALPGVARDEKTFSCNVEPNGKILIKGVTTTGEKKVYKHNMVFEMLTQNLCPPGEFSISFQLPGPIDPQHINSVFGADGIFEGVVKKRQPEGFY